MFWQIPQQLGRITICVELHSCVFSVENVNIHFKTHTKIIKKDFCVEPHFFLRMNYIVLPNQVGNSWNRFLMRNNIFHTVMLARNESGIVRSKSRIARNESRLASNETIGGNLPFKSGTVKRLLLLSLVKLFLQNTVLDAKGLLHYLQYLKILQIMWLAATPYR